VNATQIKSLAANSPFKRFVLETTGGQLIPVDKPEHIHVAPAGWPDLFVIFSDQVVRLVEAGDIASVAYE
jgi:hypothetical protein